MYRTCESAYSKPTRSAVCASFLLYSKSQLVRCSMSLVTRPPETLGTQ